MLTWVHRTNWLQWPLRRLWRGGRGQLRTFPTGWRCRNRPLFKFLWFDSLFLCFYRRHTGDSNCIGRKDDEAGEHLSRNFSWNYLDSYISNRDRDRDSLWYDLDILLFWKKPWYSSIIPVMTHSRPPMAESMPSMINMKKKITDLRDKTVRFKYTFGPAHVRKSLNEKQISLNSCPSFRQKIDHSQTGLTKTDCQAGLLQPVDRLQTPVQGLVEDIKMWVSC